MDGVASEPVTVAEVDQLPPTPPPLEAEDFVPEADLLLPPVEGKQRRRMWPSSSQKPLKSHLWRHPRMARVVSCTPTSSGAGSSIRKGLLWWTIYLQISPWRAYMRHLKQLASVSEL
ncbi:hypothetical protein GUJ93_ZPchr0001g30432 [Zizania palustris]|uniref:Uncharacterized protein n=1 Tax=Zizania palustris TaxID=103762 RepID=A0A8J5VPP3_ZIZPA|nr:hypothetical protein GUJ93_ZPchr0001g30432 [Zizania palustris]